MAKPQSIAWDKHAIRAEVTRRGATLTGIALEAGLSEGACRQALSRRHIAGEKALAKFLGVRPEALWPERYAKPSPWAKRILDGHAAASQNGVAKPDRSVAA